MGWSESRFKPEIPRHFVSRGYYGICDPLSITIADPDHSTSELRFLDIGLSCRKRVLVVSYRSEVTIFASSAQDSQAASSAENMKKQSKKTTPTADGLRPEYDFSGGDRGKHAARYAAGTNVVVLAPDVAKQFPTAEDVNETLRAVGKLIRRSRSRRATA